MVARAKAEDLFPGLEEANAAASAGDAALAVVLRIGRVLRGTHERTGPVVLMKEFFTAAKAYAEAFDRQAEADRGSR